MIALDPSRGGPLKVIMWDFKTSKSSELWSQMDDSKAHFFDPVVAISPDGKCVAACHYDLFLRCWDAKSEWLPLEIGRQDEHRRCVILWCPRMANSGE